MVKVAVIALFRQILLFTLTLNFFWQELLWILAHIWKEFGQNLELGILKCYVSQLFQRFDGKKQVQLLHKSQVAVII